MTDYNVNFTIQSILSGTRIVLDIAIMWFLIYYALKVVKNNSRTIQLFKGIIIIMLIYGFSKFLGLNTLAYFASMVVNWGFLAIIIIFQPEIRGMLERIGKSNALNKTFTLTGNEIEKLIDEIVKTTMLLSKEQVGALLSIEQSQSLQDYIKTGVVIDAKVSTELLTSIFITTTPLHDGAVIIQGDKIACASAYFPPTNLDLPSKYGARHRAAIGISEVTDCITIVVSEETGTISIAESGKITPVDSKQLREYLLRVLVNEETDVENHKTSSIFVLEDKDLVIEDETKTANKTVQSRFSIKKHDEKEENHGLFAGVLKSYKKGIKKPSTKSEDEVMKALENEQANMKLPHHKKTSAVITPDEPAVTEVLDIKDNTLDENKDNEGSEK